MAVRRKKQNTKRRRRNPGIYDDAMESIRRHTGSRLGKRVYVADVARDLEKKGYSWAEIKNELIRIMRTDEISLMRLDDPLEITPLYERYTVPSGGQANHILYLTRQGKSQEAAQSKRRRELPTGWTQASGGFQGKKSSKEVTSSDLLDAIKTLSGGRSMTPVSIADLAKTLGSSQTDVKAAAEILAMEGRAIVIPGGKQVARLNPTRRRNPPATGFLAAGKIYRKLEELKAQPATARRSAVIRKLEAALEKAYAAAYAGERAKDAALYEAPRTFATVKRKGGSVRKKKNPYPYEEKMRRLEAARDSLFRRLESGKLSEKQTQVAKSQIRILDRKIDSLFMGEIYADVDSPEMRARAKAESLAAAKIDARRERAIAKKKAKKVNPRRRNRTIIKGKRITVLSTNPSRKRVRNNSVGPVKHIREEFSGRAPHKETDLYAPDGTPANLAKLGAVISITTTKGQIQPTHAPSHGLWLCADGKGHLHLASSLPRMFEGPAGSLGQVVEIEYRACKPHLGYGKPTDFFHEMGEEGGRKPTLYSDGKGGLKFKGGDYTISREGLRN